MASISTWRMPVSHPVVKPLILMALILAAVPVRAQDGCGKLYAGQDCSMADYEAAAERMREAAAVEAARQAGSPPVPDPAANPDLRQRAFDLFRARAGVMAEAMRCCHPAIDGTMWCH